MSLSSTTNRVEYTGNGATATYAYTFRILDDDDLLVTVVSTATPPVETTLTKTTDYTVTGVGSASGGNVVLVSAAQAWLTGGNLTSGYSLVIRRVRPLKQETDIRNQGSFYPETHEDVFDHLVMIDQQQQNEIDRSVKLPESLTSSDFDPELPTDLAASGNESCVLITNATGDGWDIGPTTTQISSAQTYAIAAAASAAAAALDVLSVTGTSTVPSDLVAGTALTVAATVNHKKYIQGSGGAVVVSANPQIAAGSRDGQWLLIVGCSDTNTVKYQNGTGLNLNGQFIMKQNDCLWLNWDNTAAVWVEVARREN